MSSIRTDISRAPKIEQKHLFHRQLSTHISRERVVSRAAPGVDPDTDGALVLHVRETESDESPPIASFLALLFALVIESGGFSRALSSLLGLTCSCGCDAHLFACAEECTSKLLQ